MAGDAGGTLGDDGGGGGGCGGGGGGVGGRGLSLSRFPIPCIHLSGTRTPVTNFGTTRKSG